MSCEIPQQQLTVVTGVSGSGKSSLVFDTLYAEGQRRFVQSMSTYTRLFLDRMERPDVDFISNIPPAIALAQKNTIRNARSTVGTITEINDHLRLLYTHVGETRCPTCGGRVLRDGPDTGIAELVALEEGTSALVVAPVPRAGLSLEAQVASLMADGHRRVWIDGAIVRLDEIGAAELEARLAASAAGSSAPGGAARGREASAAGAGAGRAKRGAPREPGSAPRTAGAGASGELDGHALAADLGGDGAAGTAPAPGGPPPLPVVVDRLVAGKTSRARMREALERAFSLGAGRVWLDVGEGSDATAGSGASKRGDARTRRVTLDRRFSCRGCGRELPEPSPNLFSFNSPLGACPACEGFGRVTGIDLDKVIPDPRKTLEDGAIAPWTTPANLELAEWMLRAGKRYGLRPDVPWSRLTADEKAFVLDGEPREGKRKRGEHRFPGVRGFFRWLEGKRYKTHVRILLARYRGYTPCATCVGQRLRPEALAVRVAGVSIAELTAQPVSAIAAWARGLALDAAAEARAATLLAEVRRRLDYLIDVGLDYLTLARQARTLSGGEAQRIHLASALGSALTDTLYCLDEPTVGLHARDSKRLLDVLHKLTGAGNTVVLVEHDPAVIEGADHVIDLGPGGGARGGKVLFAGAPETLSPEASETGRLLRRRGRELRGSGRSGAGSACAGGVSAGAGVRGGAGAASSASAVKSRKRTAGPGAIVVSGARENNLKNVTVEIPHGRLTCVTGVSGSGKSTLVEQVLYANALRARGEGVEVGACDGVAGLERYDDVVLMTQAPVGRSARSNPATYLKAYDEIRRLFAATADARLAKIAPGHFSFNSAGGRCESCAGMGTVTIEMHFMADLTVTCDQCGGARFKPAVLAVRFRGRSIGDVLAMTIDEAHDFFADAPRVRSRLHALRAVGLGYLTLGQPTATLSGGEAQRLKLASFVDDDESDLLRAKPRLLIFDEPTTGLHLADVARLSDVLRGLVERGDTVLVVEHNLDFVAAADWVIDLGPDGGERGGEVVAIGTPLELARRGGTPTADALGDLLLRAAAQPFGASCGSKERKGFPL